MDNIMGKAEDELNKFMDDPEKVDKAESKAEDVLAKKMGREQADQVVGGLADVLKNVTGAEEGKSKD